MKPLFALVDCNNFFVSCERIFRPDLADKPVVVLSSNDGCIIARSNEAKKLGIPMGAPAFKYKNVFEREGIVQFSANFELYGDISRRITEILTTITPRLEVYSIDESFLDISHLPIKNYETWGREVRHTLLKWVGVPVRIGIAPTKTLAKLASDYVKQDSRLEDVFCIKDPDSRVLAAVAIEEIWGVGWQMAPKLRALGLASALDLSKLSPIQTRSVFRSVLGERLVRELNGQSCWPLEKIHKEQKSISATRTFGEEISESHVVEAALASFVARASARLRSQNLTTSKISIFLATNRHKPLYRKWFREMKLPVPTADTGILMSCAQQLLETIYDSSAAYYRGGVTLAGLQPGSSVQIDLLGTVNPAKIDRSYARMRSFDRINARHGKQTIRYAAEDLASNWQPRLQIRSPHYTTSWTELPKVKIQITA